MPRAVNAGGDSQRYEIAHDDGLNGMPGKSVANCAGW